MENEGSWEMDVETVMHPLRRISGNKEKTVSATPPSFCLYDPQLFDALIWAQA